MSRATSCTCFALTGEFARDEFTSDSGSASALALLGSALAPAEGTQHLAFGTLRALSSELSLLSCLDFERAATDDIKTALYAMSERARVAAEVIQRMHKHPLPPPPAPVPLTERIDRTGSRKPRPKGPRS